MKQKHVTALVLLVLLSFLAIKVIFFVHGNDYSFFKTYNSIYTSIMHSEKLSVKQEKRLAFVTAFSDNHMKEGSRLLSNLVQIFANTTDPVLIFYVLGLSESNTTILKSKYGHRFIIKAFNFSKYPKYVMKLFEYRWKPLVISECLKEYSGVWWMDASVTLKSDFGSIYKKVVNWTTSSKLSVTLFKPEPYSASIYAATNPGLYKYFPIPEEKSKKLLEYGSGTMLFMQSNRSEPIIHQFVKCALEKDCMAPPGSRLRCTWKDAMNDYAKCHKPDQSVINIILAVNCNYDVNCYVYQGDCGMGVHRTSIYQYEDLSYNSID